MKTTFILFFVVLMWGLTAKAGLPPTTLSGQSQTIKPTTFTFKTPNNQSTQTSGIESLIETGNTNLLDDPSFEKSTISAEWVNTGTELGLPESTVVIAGKKSWKFVPSGETIIFKQLPTLYATQFADGVQGLAMVRIKSNIALSVCSIQAGTVSTTNCVTTTTDSKWGLYKIPFILGGTSNGISIASSGSVTGTVYIDDAFVGAVDLVTDVDQSRIAGESYFAAATNCAPARTNTVMGAFATDADCVAPTIVRSNLGTWLTTDSDGPIQIINNLGAGEYIAEFEFSAFKSSVANVGWAINDGTTTCDATAGYSSTSASPKTVSCSFKYTSSGNRTFQIYTGSSSGSVTISLDDLVRGGVRFKLIYFGSGQTYSSQCGANCVDVFSFKLSSTGTVTAENSDIINGNCTNASPRVCTFNTGLFTVAPNCTTTSNDGSDTGTNAISISSTSLSVNTFNTAGIATARDSIVICQKQGADFTASRTIVGSFKEVVTTSGVSKPEIFSVAYGTTNLSTACSGSPCFIDQIGTSVTSVTRAGAGDYTMNTAKTYAKLKCSLTASAPGVSVSNGSGVTGLNCSNCSAITFTTQVPAAGAATNTIGVLICHGSN